MTALTAFEAKRMIESGEAQVASVFRHWSSGGLFVILDLGKGSAYTLLSYVWEGLFRKKGLIKEGA